MKQIIIGVDPHKLSATIEVVDRHENVLASGRFATDKAGYAAMRKHVAALPDRVWTVEGSNGAGRSPAQRLLADGEHVVDVPAKLAARARMLDTGHGRKTDAHDAHSVAVAAVRSTELCVLAADPELEALGMLVDRREELARQRTQTANRLQRLLGELTPGKAAKDITTGQAKTILTGVRPRDLVGKTRRRLAAEQLSDLVAVEKKIKDLSKELKAILAASGTGLMDLPGVGPIVAAGVLADVGDVTGSQTATGSPPGRHRPDRSILRSDRAAPTLPSRQPADEPHDPHRRDHPDSTPKAAPTTGANSPPARPGWKPCAA